MHQTIHKLEELSGLLAGQQAMPERRLGEILSKDHGIEACQLEVALQRQQRQRGRHLGRILVEMGAASPDQVHAALARKFGIPCISLEHLEIGPEVLSRLPLEVAVQYNIMPLGELDGSLVVAMENPLDTGSLDAIRFNSRRPVTPVQATAQDILLAHNKYYSKFDEDRALRDSKLASVNGADGRGDTPQHIEQQARKKPIVRLLNAIVLQGVLRDASDINLRPDGERLNVFYRIDGQLQFSRSLDKSLLAPLVSRVKIIASMDIAERRLPQDGNARLLRGNRSIDLRLSILPTVHGESVVIRVLDRERGVKRLDQLGLSSRDQDLLLEMLSRRHGLFLVTGQTGAGKTTTLYALLNEIRQDNPHIISVEDPVEYSIEGVEQIQVLEKKDMGFARILRHILRHDPDVIMVGEIRDQETAAIANRAALTGHLVLSTLHTNDAPGAVARLLDLGVAPYILGATLLGVMTQRLLRLNCPHCLEEDPLRESLAQALAACGVAAEQPFWRGAGCSHCHYSGYRGRMLVAGAAGRHRQRGNQRGNCPPCPRGGHAPHGRQCPDGRRGRQDQSAGGAQAGAVSRAAPSIMARAHHRPLRTAPSRVAG